MPDRHCLKYISFYIFGALVFPCMAEAGSKISNADGWSGCYQAKSKRCTALPNGGACKKDLNDYMLIEKVVNGFKVSLHSTQAYQSVCFFSVNMNKVNGALEYKAEYGKVLLMKSRNSIIIQSDSIDPTALGLGFCGAHADINGLSFLFSEKKPIGKCLSVPELNMK